MNTLFNSGDETGCFPKTLQIRVFSVQRVNRSFDARRDCVRRHYHYYLPAWVIGWTGTDPEEDARRMAALQAAWGTFEGNYPFHNFTKRKLYRDESQLWSSNKSKRPTGRKGVNGGGPGESEEEVEDGEGQEGFELKEDQAAEGGPPGGSKPAAAHANVTNDAAAAGAATLATAAVADGGTAAPGAAGHEEPMRRKLALKWLSEKDERDPIVRRHYRHMESCLCSPNPFELVAGGPVVVQVRASAHGCMVHWEASAL
jgi:hypothetical protein